MISVLIANRQVTLRHGLQLLLAQTPDIRLTDGTGSIKEAFALLGKNPYDALLMDICLLDRDSFSGVFTELRTNFPKLSVIVFSSEESPATVRKALAAGISGYLGKSCTPTQLIEAIRQTVAGERFLDPSIAQSIALDSLMPTEQRPHEKLSGREQEIFGLITQGKTINEISELLFRSPKTVSTHKARLMKKMGLSTDIELIRYALKNQLA